VTSRTTSIFRWIWRINGVLLLGTCVAGIVALLSLTRGMFVGVEDAPPGAITNVAGTDLTAESLMLRPFEPIKGTSLMVAPLDGRPESSMGSSVAYSFGGGGQARNLLFFDITTRKAHWLLKGNDQHIGQVTYITDPPLEGCGYAGGPSCSVAVTTQAILLQIGPRAPGGAVATSRIAIASPDGRQGETIVNDSDGLLGSRKASPTTLLVFYSVKGVARVAEVDVLARRVVSDAVLAAQD
jgi:hypothetical protein